VVNVCAVYAGMPLATADGLRKSLQKKRPVKQLAAYAEEFFQDALALGRDVETTKQVWGMILSFAGYSFCKGHSASYIQVAQHACYLRANYPAEFMAAVLANGGGFYHPFAYVAEARRMGLTILPPDVNASDIRTTGHGREVRIGLQFIKGLSAVGAERTVRKLGSQEAETDTAPYRDLEDLRTRAGLSTEDLRILIKAGACDSIAGGMTRPMMLWKVDGWEARKSGSWEATRLGSWEARELLPNFPTSQLPNLSEYTPDRQRRDQYAALSFLTAQHPMDLYTEQLRRFRLVRSTDLPRHAGQTVVAAGMLTTSKPVHTARDEPMEFATFDDGHGLIETVLFPRVYRERGHILFDQGPFLFRGKVEEEFGAISVTITQLERLERVRPGKE